MNFKEKVIKAVGKIPRGKVVSYGQIASYCGSPRAARQVGWILRTFDGNNEIPWWRVINNAGLITIKGSFIATPKLQKNYLESEHVLVSDDFKIDIEKYRFKFPISKF